jgi:hypothetical protein
LIPDIKKFLPVAIFKMSATIPHKFNIVRFQRSPFLKWPPQFLTNSTLFDFNVLNWFLTLKNFYRSPFSNCPTQYHKNSR